MNTLRTRLVLSHVLPLVVIVPLMGLALVYFIETQVLLPGLTRELVGNGSLVAEMTKDYYRLWTDPIYAQTILARVSPRLTARVMLLTYDGRLLASSDPNDLVNLNKTLLNPEVEDVKAGKTVTKVYYNQRLEGEAIDVYVPVTDGIAGTVGIVRLTYPFSTVLGEFVQFRTLIVGVLLFGLGSGALIGLLLALNIETPLRRINAAVVRLTRGEQSEPVPETGPEEVRTLASAMNALVERLRGMETARRALLANLVHELGRPLGALRSGVQALLKGASRDPQLAGELLTGMDGELVRLQALLNELTHLYDQGLGTLELKREPVNLADWLPEIIAPWQAAAVEKGIAFETDLGDSLPAVSIDPLRLGQATGNLFSNAIKFTPPGGKVRIEAKVDQTWFVLRVQDSGPGIPADEKDKIYTPFYRGSHGKRFAEGMGLGLGIAREIVQAHGGEISLAGGREGQGATFEMRIPRD